MSKRAQKELNRKLNAANKITREYIHSRKGPIRKSTVALIRDTARQMVAGIPARN